MAADGSMHDITAQVKEQSDIVQIIGETVELKRSGVRSLGLCPFHGEKTPSFSVHGGQQFFYCFGCGESGDVFSFLMKYHGVDFPQALKMVATRYNIALPERRRSAEDERRQKKRTLLFKINEFATQQYERYLLSSSKAKSARDYLRKRGVDEKTIQQYRIGYAPDVEREGWNYLGSKLQADELKIAIEVGLVVEKERGGTYDRFRDRIVFPIMDISGQVAGFGGRIVGEGKPKYLNSPESLVFNKGRLLLGLYQQKDKIRISNEVVLVEGNFDLISLVSRGCENVVAPLGTALTREQIRLVKRYAEKIVLLFDGDEAGVKAAARAVPFFLAEQVPGRVALLPRGDDPDTYIREKGVESIVTLIANAEGLPEFVLKNWIDTYGLSLDGKSKIVSELQPLIKAATSPLQRSVFISHFAEKLGLSVAELDGFLERPLAREVKRPEPQVKIRRKEVVEPLSISQRQLVEFMILHPNAFSQLEEAGLRWCLEGSLGEIIYLQIKAMLEANPLAEPEDILPTLPEGAERKLVAEVLLDASKRREVDQDEVRKKELIDLVAYLGKTQLKKKSDQLMLQLQHAQNEGDFKLMNELMQEQLRINRKIHETNR